MYPLSYGQIQVTAREDPSHNAEQGAAVPPGDESRNVVWASKLKGVPPNLSSAYDLTTTHLVDSRRIPEAAVQMAPMPPPPTRPALNVTIPCLSRHRRVSVSELSAVSSLFSTGSSISGASSMTSAPLVGTPPGEVACDQLFNDAGRETPSEKIKHAVAQLNTPANGTLSRTAKGKLRADAPGHNPLQQITFVETRVLHDQHEAHPRVEIILGNSPIGPATIVEENALGNVEQPRKNKSRGPKSAAKRTRPYEDPSDASTPKRARGSKPAAQLAQAPPDGAHEGATQGGNQVKKSTDKPGLCPYCGLSITRRRRIINHFKACPQYFGGAGIILYSQDGLSAEEIANAEAAGLYMFVPSEDKPLNEPKILRRSKSRHTKGTVGETPQAPMSAVPVAQWATVPSATASSAVVSSSRLAPQGDAPLELLQQTGYFNPSTENYGGMHHAQLVQQPQAAIPNYLPSITTPVQTQEHHQRACQENFYPYQTTYNQSTNNGAPMQPQYGAPHAPPPAPRTFGGQELQNAEFSFVAPAEAYYDPLQSLSQAEQHYPSETLTYAQDTAAYHADVQYSHMEPAQATSTLQDDAFVWPSANDAYDFGGEYYVDKGGWGGFPACDFC
ncbi:hypothetical protein H0H81_008531 [Sphagnurus paluster]|uniref:Uncharacterized protein n=1 Tax=Sphagnurus paluster TaxID=117069 RepID=A0A9P7GK01_9AGAR|nr:hypothetical protein H0H81_008531 [Sphagnurus paluster]